MEGCFMGGAFTHHLSGIFGGRETHVDFNDGSEGLREDNVDFNDSAEGLGDEHAAEHRYCMRYIHQNMSLTWRGGMYKELLWKAAIATTIVEFNKILFHRAHCDLLINNICEVFNRQLLDARDSPVVSALEYVREYLMKRIVVVQKVIEKSDGPLTPSVTKVFKKIKEASAKYIVDWNGDDLIQVKGPYGDQCVVNLQQRVCSCRKWEVSGLQRFNTLSGMKFWELKQWPTTLIPPKIQPQIRRPPKKRKKSGIKIEDIVRGGKLSKKVKLCDMFQ
ncbi:hypothetical protein Tco_0199344 [Tanacetum coccineum]